MIKYFKIAAINLFFLISIASFGQDYNNAIGGRLGFTQGLTYRHFLSEATAIEGIFSTRWGGFILTGLYEVHKDLNRYNLRWFFGGGAHVGFFSTLPSSVHRNDIRDSYTIVGIDGILGIDYTFPDVPINLSLDWKPVLNFVGGDIAGSAFWVDGGAISIRYVLN